MSTSKKISIRRDASADEPLDLSKCVEVSKGEPKVSEPPFDIPTAYADLSKRIDNLTVLMLEVRDLLKSKSDLSFLGKFCK